MNIWQEIPLAGLVHSFYLRAQRAQVAHMVRITTLTRKATIKHFPKLRCSWRAYGCLSWLLTIQFPITIAHEFNYVVQIGLVHSFYLRTQRAPIAHLVRITTLTRKATIKHFPKLRCSWRAYGCLSWLLTIQFPITIAHEFNYVVQIHESQDSVV